MDHGFLDRLIARLGRHSSRRAVFSGLGALNGLTWLDVVKARKKRKKTKKRVRFNDFGCVNVGGFCKNSGQCCSGICAGKKGNKKCRAHDGGSGCQAGQAEGCAGNSGTCTSSTGLVGACDTTTGNAGYCGNGFKCMDCRKDVECQDRCGQAAAVCITCPDCDGTGALQTACVGPGSLECI